MNNTVIRSIKAYSQSNLSISGISYIDKHQSTSINDISDIMYPEYLRSHESLPMYNTLNVVMVYYNSMMIPKYLHDIKIVSRIRQLSRRLWG